MNVLVVDNYDSFTYNLADLFGQLGAEVRVIRNDAITPEEAEALAPSHLVVSPGPGRPEDAGVTIRVIERLAGKVPMLGVCLGHQALGVVYGATVDRAPELLHGKTSQVHHDGTGVLKDLPAEFTATRYHSLTVVPDTIPADVFEVTGRTETGIVMGMRHRELPLESVQFHPESVLTEGGHRMLANWLAAAGHPVDPARVDELERATKALQKAAVA